MIAAVQLLDDGEIEHVDLPIQPNLIDMDSELDSQHYLRDGCLNFYFQTECRVKDVFRGKLEVEADSVRFSENQTRHTDFNRSAFNDHPAENCDPCVLLVLESPHISEFQVRERKLAPVAPAQGRGPNDAGQAIFDHIGRVVIETNALAPGEYNLVISNPVPFQTSMAHILKKDHEIKGIKDKIWRRIWKTEIAKKDFESRVERYEPELVLNACTSSFNLRIGKFIATIIDPSKVFNCYHPARNWRNERYNVRQFE